MSSKQNLSNYSQESDSSNDRIEPSNSEKKICFICGSHTIHIVNIHEPRSGPNMIEVISEKFKMRPLHDDKFLCFSCNNWLINWYTVQKYDHQCDSSNEVTATTSSQARGNKSGNNVGSGNSSGSSNSQNNCNHKYHVFNQTAAKYNYMNNVQMQNESTIDDLNIISITNNNKNNDTIANNGLKQNYQNNTNNIENNKIDLILNRIDNNIIDSTSNNKDDIFAMMRSKLNKYLYYPNKTSRRSNYLFIRKRLNIFNHQSNYLNIKKSKSKFNSENSCSGKRKRIKRKRYSSTIHLPNCNNYKLKQYYCYCKSKQMNTFNVTVDHSQIESESIVSSSDSILENRVQNILKESNIVDKLKSLGTTIYCETDNKMQFELNNYILVDSSSDLLNSTNNKNDEINEIEYNDLDKTKNRLDESNDILLSFNTVVTEVFPIKYLRNINNDHIRNQTNDIKTNRNDENITSASELIKNLPKSLTITLT